MTHSTPLIELTPPDSDLIMRLRSNDLSALEVLFDRYQRQVHRTALLITRDAAVADDILQEVMLKLYQHAHRIDTALLLAPWLYRVTVNLAYSWATRTQRRWISIEGLVDQLVSPIRHAPDKQAEQHETELQIRNAIESLPLNQRTVVVLHYLNELDLAEIAEILELPLGTVKSRLYYARETLRRLLGDTFRIEMQAMGWESGEAHGYHQTGGAARKTNSP
jgi:RNA polymerase sigma-70 factor (ECF subfamily)